MSNQTAVQIAEKIRNAETSGQLIEPVKSDFLEPTIDAAYEVQRINTEFHLSEGRIVSGRKIGLTSPAVQKQLGVDQPDFGVLWKDTEYQDGEEIPFSRLHQPKIECEVALVLGRAIDHPHPGISEVLRAVDYVVPALEIVGSRIADWQISIVDTIADNASAGMYVLGATPRKLDGIDLRLCGMVMERDNEPVSTGCGAACMGHPLHAAVWLAQTMVAKEMPLEAGDIVLTGALGPMVNIQPGDSISARIEGLGSVRATFSTD